MRAIYIDVPEDLIRQRRRLGIDRCDEMWEGELHMSPPPSWEHQGIDQDLVRFFLLHWQDLGEGHFRSNVGVRPRNVPLLDIAGEKLPEDFRAPDLVFLVTGTQARLHRGWVVGAPDALIEIRSPGDETYEKFPFYHALGVPEVIVIHRDSKAVEVYARARREYRRVAPGPDGSVASKVLDTEFRTVRGTRGAPPTLHLRRAGDPERRGSA